MKAKLTDAERMTHLLAKDARLIAESNKQYVGTIPVYNKLKFSLEAKQGITSKGKIEGIEVPEQSITREDLNEVIKAEHLLERLFGLRFHINCDVKARMKQV